MKVDKFASNMSLSRNSRINRTREGTKQLRLVSAISTLIAVAFNAWSPESRAATIRHDKADSLYVDAASKARFAPVGLVEGPWYAGSGVLISPTLVLTAGHITRPSKGSLSFTIGGHNYQSSRITSHPAWNGNLDTGVDLGIFQLERPVTSVAPAALNATVNPLGLEATFVGYGKTGTGLTGAVRYDGIMRASRNVFDVNLGRSDILGLDFDHPTNSSYSAFGSSKPLEREGLPSFGDSGGGAFIERAGNWSLAGICSYGIDLKNPGKDDSYGDVIAYTSVAPHINWIRRFLAGSGDWSSRFISAAVQSSGGAVPKAMVATVPEPATLGFAVVGLLVAGSASRKTRPSAKAA